MTPTAIRLLQHRCRAGARKRRSRRMDRCHMNNDWMIVPSHWILSGNPQIRIRSIRKMTASRSSGRRSRSTQRQPICGSADWVGQALRARRAGRHGCGAVRPEGFGSTSCDSRETRWQPRPARSTPAGQHQAQTAGVWPMRLRRCRQPSPSGSGRGVAMGCSGWIAPPARGSRRAMCRATSTRRSKGTAWCRRSYAAASRRMTAGDDAP
jgi:hypothetical protein